jgi:hypothetical protein
MHYEFFLGKMKGEVHLASFTGHNFHARLEASSPNLQLIHSPTYHFVRLIQTPFTYPV